MTEHKRCTHGIYIDGKGGDPNRFRCEGTQEGRQPLPGYCLRHYRDELMKSESVGSVSTRLVYAMVAHIELLERAAGRLICARCNRPRSEHRAEPGERGRDHDCVGFLMHVGADHYDHNPAQCAACMSGT